ncbi:MAG TPA: PAS domain S-box protein, partial [Terriglobales bacterium]|nr:PAS domain S-box protein [Terriglobales bacterium]
MRFRLNPPVTTSPFIRYAVSVVTSVAAFALNISFSSESGRPLFLIYAVAAGLSAWTGGFMPGLLSVLLGASGAAFLLIRSSGNFQAIARFDHFRFGLYVIASLCLVWLIAELHAARMALLRRDEHFRRAQRSARISAFEWNLDSGEVIWSEELPAVQGRGPDKDFESWMLNVHPEDREQLRQALRRAIEHGEDLSVDLRLREAQGPNNWVSLRAEIERDGSGEPVRALGVVIDITARKLTERRLAARHATSLILSGSRSLAEAAPRALASICECLGWEVGVLWNQPEGALSLHCHSVYAPDQGFEEFVRSTQAQSFAPGIGLPGRVWKSGEAAWISDLAQDTNFPRSDAALQERLQSAFAFPLKTAAGVAGVVEFLTCELRPPDRELLDMMSDLGSHIGQFIERTHAQTELRQSEERYRTLTETASDMILTINANSTIVFANRATERVLGYELDELIGKSITVLMPHDLRDLHLNGLPRYLRTGQRQMSWDGVELAALHKNGHEVQLEISFSAFVAHGERMFTGVARDVTERKRVADALRESERWLATTLNSIGDAVIATDGTGCVRLINPIAESLTGWAASEAIGSRLDQVFRLINDQHQTMENPAARIGRTGGNLGIVEQGNVVSRQGDEIAIEIIGTPMRDDRG